MLNSKFDLYETGWLDLVFSDRNRNYGAYDLRQHYGNTMVKAMGITFFSVTVLFVSFGFAMRSKPPVVIKDLPMHPPVLVVIHPEIHQAKHGQTKQSVKPPAAPEVKPLNTIKYVVPVVKPDELAPEEQPKMDELEKSVISSVDNKVKDGDPGMQNGVPEGKKETDGGGKGDEPVNGSFEALEVMPEPFGGAAGWAKFLQKNLRFPTAAVERGVSAKVFVSFIVERDGRLSDITVLRKMGYGFDEEALRVLKLAPAWRPGKQNGQSVRVRYTLPLSFVIAEE